MSAVPDALVAALQGLVDAARGDDPYAAEPFATPEGWASRANSARRLVKFVHGDGLDLEPVGPAFITPDDQRAAVRTRIREGERQVDQAWVVFRRHEGSWRVEGHAESPVILQLFLAGTFSPVTALEDLPSDPAGEAAGEAHLAAVRAGEDTGDARLARLIAEGFDRVHIEQVVALDAVDRVGVLFVAENAEHHSRDSFSVYRRTPDGLEPVAHGRLPDLSDLLDGVEILPATEGETIEERLDDLLGSVLGRLLEAVGVGPGELPAGGGKALLETLSHQAAPGGVPQAALLDPELYDAAVGGDLAHKMERRVQVAVDEALRAQGVDPGALDPDTEAGRQVLAEHAPLILRTTFGAILLTAAPAARETAIPEARPDVVPWIRAAIRHLASQPPAQA